MKAYTLLFPLLLVACHKNSPPPAIITPPDTVASVAPVPLDTDPPYCDSFYGKLTLSYEWGWKSYDTMVTLCVRHASAATVQFSQLHDDGSWGNGEMYIDGFTNPFAVNDSNHYSGYTASQEWFYKFTKDSLMCDIVEGSGHAHQEWIFAGIRTNKPKRQ